MSRSILLGAALMAIFLFFATYGGLTATPKFWHDEAVPFEIARNIAEFGKADLAVAPNTFWKKSYMTHATGFPLTFPLAGVFKIFGIGVLQSRLFMIAWMLAALATLFFVMHKFFEDLAVKPPSGGFTAIFSVLLVATFSSFYANGRTGTGEIPGFLFLLIALYFLYQKKQYEWGDPASSALRSMAGGFFAALAAVTKPSMYLLVLPAILLSFLRKQESNYWMPNQVWHDMIKFILGSLPVLLFWLWLINPAPFSLASWQEMAAFYQNAFNAPSLLSQFPAIIPLLLTHSTIIYFGALLIIIIFAWWKNLFSPTQNRFVRFLLLYGAFSFFYFLRSPGWFRYLLGTELLILALLPAALQKGELWRAVLSVFTGLRARSGHGAPTSVGASEGEPSSQHAGLARKVKMLSTALLLSVALSQSAQYLLDAEIPSDTKSIEIAQFINQEILANDPAATIGIIDQAPIAALISADRKYQRVAVGGYETFVGKHPLSLPSGQLPMYFVFMDQEKNAGYEDVLEKFYQPYRKTPHDVLIYKKISIDQLD